VSTILKALQRLEDEKSANVERSLEEQVVERRPPPRPARRGLKIGAVAIGGLAIGGLAIAGAAFFFWQTQEKPGVEVAMEPPPPATESEPAKKVAAEKPRRKKSTRQAPASRVEEEPSAVEISPVVEVVKHLDSPPADLAESAASSKGASSSEDGKSEDVAAAPSKAKLGAVRPGGRRPASKPEPKIARTAEQAKPAPEQVAEAKPPATQVSGSSIPAIETPSQPAPVEIAAVAPKPVPAAEPAPIPAAIKEPTKKTIARAKIPKLSIEKTIWHPDVNRRVALVKLLEVDEVVRLKEGDAVGPLVVIDINPGSVLFTHDDVEIRYNVGG